jgi:hypothetical protein
LLCGNSPSHFEISTNAALEAILAVFPEAVLVDSRYPVVMCPTSAGPVDLTSFRATARGEAQGRVEEDLPHRDFTINAMAYRISDHEIIDPYEGKRDLSEGVLRTVGVARDCLAEDPVRALRALRLVATRGFKLHPELEIALATVRVPLAKIPRQYARCELTAILLAPGVAAAMDALDRSGIAWDLAPQVPAKSGAMIERLPCDLSLRLAGWLRGTAPRRPLQKLRFTRPLIDQVEALLRVHPVDAAIGNTSAGAMLHFVRRTGLADVTRLISLCEAEIAIEVDGDAPGRDGGARLELLERLRKAVQELRVSQRKAHARDQLAISGSDVMKILGCPPGPAIGSALAYLTERITAEASLNSPEQLETLVREWSGAQD